MIAGSGPLEPTIKDIFKEQGVAKRLHFAGVLKGQDLVDCYHAMTIYAFASVSETQGIVLVEAMAAGIPVVAMDAPGVREVVKDGYNGRLIFEENQYRTTKVNEVVSLMCLNNNELDENKKGHQKKDFQMSRQVVRTGIEPVLPE